MTNEKSLDDFVDDGVRQRILSFLPFKDRVRVESVSRAWRSASLDYNCKHTTSLSVIGYQVNRNFNQNFCTTASHRIHKLTDIIVRTDGMTDLSSVLKKVPRLKSLHLKVGEYEPILMNGEAAEIARLLPDLQHFSLSDDKIGANVYDDVIEIVEDMKNLVHLEVSLNCSTCKRRIDNYYSILPDEVPTTRRDGEDGDAAGEPDHKGRPDPSL